jgi:hypothetical protein
MEDLMFQIYSRHPELSKFSQCISQSKFARYLKQATQVIP